MTHPLPELLQQKTCRQIARMPLSFEGLRVTKVLPIGAILVLAVAAYADDWPQWQGPKRDGVWREDGILHQFPKGGPKVLWRKEVGGGFTGPAVAQGRVYLMDRQGDKLGKGKEVPGKGGLKGAERVLCYNA